MFKKSIQNKDSTGFTFTKIPYLIFEKNYLKKE